MSSWVVGENQQVSLGFKRNAIITLQLVPSGRKHLRNEAVRALSRTKLPARACTIQTARLYQFVLVQAAQEGGLVFLVIEAKSPSSSSA